MLERLQVDYTAAVNQGVLPDHVSSHQMLQQFGQQIDAISRRADTATGGQFEVAIGCDWLPLVVIHDSSENRQLNSVFV